ncbi:MAG: twin-arginine translocation signal domain-containing protein [Burkholderiales bacterium]
MSSWKQNFSRRTFLSGGAAVGGSTALGV